MNETDFERRTPGRRLLRFGSRLGDGDTRLSPATTDSPIGYSGKLTAAWLRPSTGEVWLELTTRALPWRSVARVIAPTGGDATPPGDAITLRASQRVVCHEGYVGRVVGVMIETGSGVVNELAVRIRSDLQTDVRHPTDPFGMLARLAGQDALIAAAWIVTAHDKHAPAGADGDAHLSATVEQIASAAVLRPDGAISADISQTLERNPAIAPFLGRIEIVAHDGAVVLRGAVPSARHRASAEQDAWHVPGVVSLLNELRITG